MSVDAKAAAGAKLDAIVLWSKCTFIATALGVLVLLGAVGYGLAEYWRLKGAVAQAQSELATRIKAVAVRNHR